MFSENYMKSVLYYFPKCFSLNFYIILEVEMQALEFYSMEEIRELIREEVQRQFEIHGGKPFMNIAEVSKYLGLSKATIYKYIQNNKIPFYRKDKKVYFKRSDVDFYVLDSENRFFSMSELESEADTWIALRRMSGVENKKRKK